MILNRQDATILPGAKLDALQRARQGARQEWRTSRAPSFVLVNSLSRRAWCHCLLDGRLCGIAQILLGRCFFPQFPEPSVAEFLLHALSELVRFAQKTACPGWLRAFALVIHVTVRFVSGIKPGSYHGFR